MATATLNPVADTMLRGSVPLNNYGNSGHMTGYLSTDKYLMRFNLSGIASGNEATGATLKVYKTNTADSSRTTAVNIYAIASANGDWIEGTKDNAQALSGEPCWNAKAADGAGGVTTAWAGSAGLETAGTDYVNTSLGSTNFLRHDAIYTEYTFTLNASGLAVLNNWFGAASNPGFVLIPAGSTYVAIGSRTYNTAGYRPVLTIEYAPVSHRMSLLGVGK